MHQYNIAFREFVKFQTESS